MIKVIYCASVLYNKYIEDHQEKISEMLLHKMLYFAQRESLIRDNQPLFSEVIYAWKFGPVIKEVRQYYKENSFLSDIPQVIINKINPILTFIYIKYANRDPWSLSRLSHGEYCWQKARGNIEEGENSDNPIDLNDMKIDAERIKQRRKILSL